MVDMTLDDSYVFLEGVHDELLRVKEGELDVADIDLEGIRSDVVDAIEGIENTVRILNLLWENTSKTQR